MVGVIDKGKALKTIAEKLKDLHWMIDSGMAVEIYTNGRRTAKDIDIVTLEKDFEEVAKRLGAKTTFRSVDKGGLKIIREKYASGVVGNVPIEIVCGSGKIIINGRERNMRVTEMHFNYAKKVKYLGVKVNVAAKEETIVHKTIMGREKDKKDIKSLMENFEPDIKILEHFLDMYQADEEERKSMLSKIL